MRFYTQHHQFYCGIDLHARDALYPGASSPPAVPGSSEGRAYLLISGTPTLKHNLPSFEKRIDRRSNRSGIGARFTDPVVRTSVEVDVALMDALHEQINAQVPEHDPVAVHLLRSIPGIGKILALVILLRDPRHQSLLEGR
ncbi:MAG: 3'-5' exoribonuclease [Planctomycetes bacterium]|nr:3'-5' exoribonuclease [Planctomycetota bacterium]